MGIILHSEPKFKNAVMIVGWPGICNIGLIAVDTLREITEAKEFGGIESIEFFPPKKVIIKSGLLENLEFPTNKFFYKKHKKNDLIFFISEEQPKKKSSSGYAEGAEAYRMANLVLDIAEQFGCKRIYTSGAAVSFIHHTMVSRVWAVPNTKRLIQEIKGFPNTIMMSNIEDRSGRGFISGLNGLLLGVARKRGFEGICLMGEIPVYFQSLPIPYPKASKSVLEVFSKILEIRIDFSQYDEVYRDIEKRIEDIYNQIPSSIKDQLEKMRDVSVQREAEIEPMTEENRKKLWDEISDFLKKGNGSDEEAG
ncbi:MAG: PAC2 family protein [Nitrospirota bacterium]|nr:PAC2 family protein [Nitrospirota bacterium]MDH5767829.1 PAC2 family protein [Nitrospirota bacterium]